MLLKLYRKEALIFLRHDPFYDQVRSLLKNETPKSSIDWTRMSPYLNHHGLSARAYRLHTEGKLNLPKADLEAFKKHTMGQIYRHSNYFNTLKEILPELKKHNFSWSLLKGLPLAQKYYENFEDRDFSDIDFLVTKDNTQIIPVLNQFGYKEAFEVKLKENRHKKLFLHNQNKYLPIEIHFGFGDYPLKSDLVFSQVERQQIRFGGEQLEVNVLSPKIEWDYLLYHACIQHRLSHLKWMMDFYEINNKFELSDDIENNNLYLKRAHRIVKKHLETKDGIHWIWSWVYKEQGSWHTIRVALLRSYFTSPLAFISFQIRKFASKKRGVSD